MWNKIHNLLQQALSGSACWRYETMLALYQDLNINALFLFCITGAKIVDVVYFSEFGGNPSLQAIQVRSAF